MNASKKGFSRPTKKIDPKLAEQFISGAEKKPSVDPVKKEAQQEQTKAKELTKKMPWDHGNEKILKGYNFRMNEIMWLKLKYIVDNTPLSMQKFIEKAVSNAMDKELKKLLNS